MKQPILAPLAMKYLSSLDKPIEADAEDLVNAILIMQAVAHSLSWQHYSYLTIEEKAELCTAFGTAIRESVTKFTGIDPADAIRGNDGWPDTIEEKLQ